MNAVMEETERQNLGQVLTGLLEQKGLDVEEFERRVVECMQTSNFGRPKDKLIGSPPRHGDDMVDEVLFEALERDYEKHGHGFVSQLRRNELRLTDRDTLMHINAAFKLMNASLSRDEKRLLNNAFDAQTATHVSLYADDEQKAHGLKQGEQRRRTHVAMLATGDGESGPYSHFR